MKLVRVKCAFCGKKFFRYFGRVNEARKFGWNQYCSKKCQRKSQVKKFEIACTNCDKKAFRLPNELKKSKSGHLFCCSSCAAIFNNPLRKRRREIRTCPTCGKQFSEQEKYCSQKCSAIPRRKSKSQKEKEILDEIKIFYKTNNRIPTKKKSLA